MSNYPQMSTHEEICTKKSRTCCGMNRSIHKVCEHCEEIFRAKVPMSGHSRIGTELLRENGFTALRLLAAFLVLMTHSTALLKAKQDFLGRRHLPQFSELAVDAFFVISGFLICLALLRNPSIATYIRNRCLRIFPALIVVVLLTILVVGPLYYTGQNYWVDAKPWQYLWNITLFWPSLVLPGVFQHNSVAVLNGSLWTLSVEMLCYSGLLLLSWSRALNWRMLLILFVITFIVKQNNIISEENFFLFHCNRLIMFFIGGSLLATLKNYVPFNKSGLFLSIVLVVYAFYGHRWPVWQQPSLFLILYPYIIIASALQLKKCHWLDKYDCSYGIYIYAFLIQQCLIATYGAAHWSSTEFVLQTTVLTVPIALASWFLIEKPALRLKNMSFVPRRVIRVKSLLPAP